ncbi:MAG: hypothetical protein GX963_11165 [Bacteroidales bacterium]|nr:hypothetical protein [Bacteroidales bacterium]
MNQFTEQLKQEVEDALHEIHLLENGILQKSLLSIELIEKAFDRLRLFMQDYQFPSEKEEIHFFKELKPRLFSNLIYYRKVYNIEIIRPKGGNAELVNYLRKELLHIRDFFERNKAIYAYYRSADTSMDKELFLRGNRSNAFYQEAFYFERDRMFSTCCDFKIAKIIATDKIEEYLITELGLMEENNYGYMGKKLIWTASKVHLVELIYSLFLSGCFNYGKVSLKEITAYFEKIFNIELGANVSRIYVDIRRRRQRTCFLDILRRLLNKRMDQEDEK